MSVDVEQLLQEVSPDSPCGEDLEYDPAFGEMERASQGKPEQQMGDSVVPAEEPDWRDVRSKAEELFGRTKDLRAAVYLARAELSLGGLPGFADGLQLIRGLLERHWEGVHPQLDAEDDNDPTMRVNALLPLVDQESTVHQLHTVPLVSVRALGRFGLRDLDIASGALTPPPGDEPPPDMGVIDAAFMECDLEELQATAAAVDRAVEYVVAIDATLTERVGVAQAPDLGELPKMLKTAQQVLADRLGRRGIVAEGAEVEGEVEAQPAQGISGEMNSREDVIRMLDKACDYFSRHEPSSPVPLLLQRAKRLISKDFMEIMKDLAPDGVSQAETIGGIKSEE